MRTPLIAGNWKMNTTVSEAEKLVQEMLPELETIRNVDRVICPPFVSLSVIKELLKESTVELGAQNLYFQEKGAYTGEISPVMLAELCQYVIIGHSERRVCFKESNVEINRKIKAALKNRLKPIFCIGEKDRDSFDSQGELINEMSLIVGEQIEKGLSGIAQAKIPDIVIAYEPVWAIGTGIPCLPNDAMKASLLIKKTLTNLYNRSIAERTMVIYGGSVISQNASDYISEANMNGLLIGGASLNASEFIKIINKITS